MRYEWDERKNHQNQRKHGISFELAAEVFEDPDRLIGLDREDESGEQRWLAIGAASMEAARSAILVVAHVYRYSEEDRHDEEIIRIISARAAGRNEIGRYQEKTLD